MRRCRPGLLWTVALVAGATSAVTIVASQAEAHRRGIAFRDDRPLTLSVDEAQAGRLVPFCNAESGEATSLDAQLNGFELKARGGDPIGVDAAFESLGGPGSLPGGGCDELSVRMKPGVTLAAASYAGVLTISSRGAGLARKDLTIVVEAKPKPVTATGFLADAPLRANRDGPHLDVLGLEREGGTELEDGGLLPLRAPKRGSEKLDLPPRGTPLGSIFNGSDRARVFVGSGAVSKYDDVWLLPLRVESADQAGDYKGKLDVARSGKEAEAVPVTLSVKDDWEWAVIAIVLGAAIPALIQLALTRDRPLSRLGKRRRELDDRYRDAQAAFERMPDPFPGFRRPSDAAIKAYQEHVAQNVRRYSKSVIYVDLTSAAYKALDASLRQAEDDADCFGAEKDGLHSSLTALVKALGDLGTYLTEKLRIRTHPKLIRTAGALLEEKELTTIGEATARKEQLDDFTKFIGEWTAIAERTRGLEAWLRRLAQPDRFDRLPGPDHARLERAAIHVAEAKQELMAAPDRASLDKLGAARNLDSAYSGLAYLGAKYQTPQPDPDTPLSAYQVDWERLDIADQYRLSLDLTGTIDQSLVLWRPGWETAREAGTATVAVAAATAGVIEEGLFRLWDLLILVSTVAIGIAAGMSVLYIDKPFGTTGDYVTAIAVGAASQVLSKGVLDALTAMRAQDAEPLETQPPKPAKAVPQVA